MIHRLTHRHTTAKKPGVGEMLFCSHRVTDNVKGIWYRTPLEGAQWVEVPPDMALFERILQSDTYLEAVAHIRRAWDKEETP